MQRKEFERGFIMEGVLEGGGECIKVNEPLKQHQWFTEYLLIFENEGLLWQTIYHKGHGENNELPFEYRDVIDCVRVWERPVTSVEYVTEDPEEEDLEDAMELQDN